VSILVVGGLIALGVLLVVAGIGLAISKSKWAYERAERRHLEKCKRERNR
jgi:hypothetical protein